MFKKFITLFFCIYSLSASATGNYYCEALCAFKPSGYAENYILIQEEAASPVASLNKLRASCANYEGSYGYLYKSTPEGRPDKSWTQASVENSCKTL